MEQAIIELTRAVNRLADAVQTAKEGKEEHSPRTPYKEKGKKPTTTTTTRARARFRKPTVEEVAAYIHEKGYSFDADRFWNYYESKGWKIGRNSMTSWRAACVTWQMRESEASSAALERLAPGERAFARAVLRGATWRETGIGKRGFNKRLAKLCAKVIRG